MVYPLLVFEVVSMEVDIYRNNYRLSHEFPGVGVEADAVDAVAAEVILVSADLRHACY